MALLGIRISPLFKASLFPWTSLVVVSPVEDVEDVEDVDCC